MEKNKIRTVLVFNRYPLDKRFHLKSKFDGQVSGFTDLGLNTKLLCFDKNSFYIAFSGKNEKIGTAHTWLPYYFHLFYYIEAGLCVSKYLRENNEIDILYYRWSPCFRALYKMAQTAHIQGCKVVCELPSYYADGNKGEKDLSIFRSIYRIVWEYWQRKMDKSIDLYALIGDKNETGMYRGRPSIDITNAINVDSIKLRSHVKDEKIHILALGTMGEWHGFDRLINASSKYQGKINYCIHFVGNNAGGCLEKWKDLASKTGADKNIVFHGPLYGDDLDKMFDICDVGVSSLGAYRIGVENLASLKLREYAARGLPFVYSANDSAIDNRQECQRFAFKIPNDDSIPDMEEILYFAIRTRNDTGVSIAEREYARDNMQWQEQFEKVLVKLDEL